MASKLTLIDISSGFKGTDIQTNFTSIEDEFDDTLSRSGKTPNQMEADIDMNSKRVMNLPAPTSSTEPLRKDDQFTSTEAQSFATDAETAKDAAEAALETFQSQYVGESATDPTTDGNGDALTEGDLYFDTANNLLKAYDGASWINPALLYFPNVDANVTATEGEINILDGATVTTAELNVLDGVTASTAELNELVNSERNTYDLTAPAGSGFTGGTLYVQRVGAAIILTSKLNVTHASASSVDSGAILDAAFIPVNDMTIVNTADASGIQELTITTSGHVVVEYRDWSGTFQLSLSFSSLLLIDYLLYEIQKGLACVVERRVPDQGPVPRVRKRDLS